FTDFIKNQPQELGKALGAVIWRSRSEFKLPKSLLDIATECNSVSGYKFKVGMSDFANNRIQKYEDIFSIFFNSNNKNYPNIYEFWQELKKNIQLGYKVFNLSDSTKYHLFSKTSQNTDLGFKNLFECYERGIKRLGDIYKQDIEKSKEHNTTGRHAQDVIVETYLQ
ncbi:6108_t:CDS:2, partial [Dentiscutata heterogama]